MTSKDKILIVEDDEDTRYILTRSLIKSNYDVMSCENGVEALKILETYSPKIIIADWTMPEMDGLEFCRLLKEDQVKKIIYYILLTARSSIKDRVTGLDFGADDFLVKPVETQELLARIRSGVRIYNLQMELKNIEHKKALIEMACTIGHQINNPLSSLFLSYQNLQEELGEELRLKYNDDLLIIKEASERIKNLVQTLINIENPEMINYSNSSRMLKIEDNKLD